MHRKQRFSGISGRMARSAFLALIVFLSVLPISLQPAAAQDEATVTVQIRYRDEASGQEIAAPYKAVLRPGDPYSVESPVVSGYTLTDPALSTISGTASADRDYTVTYTAGTTVVAVHHYFETIDGLYVQDSLLDQQITAARNTTLNVEPAQKSGYTCVSDLTLYVPTTGTVDKDLYYQRTGGDTIIYFVTGSTYVPYITAEPGSDISTEKARRMPGGALAPTRAGYRFAGWIDEAGNDAEIPEIMPDHNLQLQAKWIPGEAEYTIVYRFRELTAYRFSWDGQPTGTPEYYDFMTVTRTGTAGDPIVYSWDSETAEVRSAIRAAFYEFETADTDKEIAADGSTTEYVYCQPVQVKLYLYYFWHRALEVDENGNHTGTYDKGYLSEIRGGGPQYLRLGDYITLPAKEELFDHEITYQGHTYTAWDLIFFNHSIPDSPYNDPDRYTVFWPYSNYAFAENFDYPPSTNMISGHPFITESMLDQTVVPGDPGTYHKDPYVSEDRVHGSRMEDYSDTRRNGTGVEYNYDDLTGSYVVSIVPYYSIEENHDYYIQFYHENPNLTAETAGAKDRVITDNVNGTAVTKVYEPANLYHYQSTNDVFWMHPMFTRGFMLEYYARIRSGVAYDPQGTPPELTDGNYYLTSVNQPYVADQPAEKKNYKLQDSTGRVYLELFYSAKTYPLTFLEGSTVLAESRPADASWPADRTQGGYAYQERVDLGAAYQALTGQEKPTPPAGKEDYTFGGWYAQDNPQQTVVTGPVAIARGENRYVAKWIKPQYTVSFDANGGSAVPSQTIYQGETAVPPEDPVREGFTFAGWYYQGSFARYEFDRPVESDIALIAMWQDEENPAVYTVRHQLAAADGSVTVFRSETGEYHDNYGGKDGNPDHYVTARALDGSDSGFPAESFIAAPAAGLLLESGERTITFTYTADPQYTYTVRCLDRDTGEALRPEQTIRDTARIMTVTAPTIAGYTLDQPDVYGQAFSQGSRIITFYYRPVYPAVSVDLPVRETIRRSDGAAAVPDVTGKYSFTIAAPQGAPLPETTVLSNPEPDGGWMEFGPLTFSEPGTYTYTVSQTGRVEGITNDPQPVRTVVVTVSRQAGNTLKAVIRCGLQTIDSGHPLLFENLLTANDIPDTADGSHRAFYSILLACSLGGLMVAGRRRKRR